MQTEGTEMPTTMMAVSGEGMACGGRGVNDEVGGCSVLCWRPVA